MNPLRPTIKIIIKESIEPTRINKTTPIFQIKSMSQNNILPYSVEIVKTGFSLNNPFNMFEMITHGDLELPNWNRSKNFLYIKMKKK